MRKPSEKKLVYKTTLKKTFGLTDSMIRELGEPDKVVKNPHYSSGPPAHLYSVERVERWVEENPERVEKARKRREKLSKALTQAAKKKRRDLVSWCKNVEIKCDAIPPDIHEEAKRHYEEFFMVERGKIAHTPGINGVVSYVRHNYTNYHELLAKIEGKPGASEAYWVIRDRVDDAAMDAIRSVLDVDEDLFA